MPLALATLATAHPSPGRQNARDPESRRCRHCRGLVRQAPQASVHRRDGGRKNCGSAAALEAEKLAGLPVPVHVLRLVREILVSDSCVSRLPPVSLNTSRVSRVCPGSPGVFLPVHEIELTKFKPVCSKAQSLL